MMMILRRILSRLDVLFRRRTFRCIESAPGVTRRIHMKDRGGRWSVIASEVLPIGDRKTASGEQTGREEGALIVDGFVPVWFEPPPTDEGHREEWINSYRPVAAGEVEPLLSGEGTPRYGAWVRADVLAGRLEKLENEYDLDYVMTDLAQIIPLCAKGGHQGPWMGWWIGAEQSLCWWMNGDVIHYACRLRGGLSDPSLLEEELRSVLGPGGPPDWDRSPVAVIGDDLLERLDPIVTSADRARVPFPLDRRWSEVPARFLLVAAAVDREGVLDAALDGPYERDDRDRARAIRFGWIGFVGCIAIALGWAGLSMVSWQLERRNQSANERLEPERAGLKEFDSLRLAHAAKPPEAASRYLSEVSRCLPVEGRLLDWTTTSGSPRRHAMLLEVANEEMKLRFGACLESSRLFEAATALSTEVRRGTSRDGKGSVTVLWDVPEEVR